MMYCTQCINTRLLIIAHSQRMHAQPQQCCGRVHSHRQTEPSEHHRNAAPSTQQRYNNATGRRRRCRRQHRSGHTGTASGPHAHDHRRRRQRIVGRSNGVRGPGPRPNGADQSQQLRVQHRGVHAVHYAAVGGRTRYASNRQTVTGLTVAIVLVHHPPVCQQS